MIIEVDLSEVTIMDDGQVIVGDEDSKIAINGEFLTEILWKAIECEKKNFNNK